MCFSLRATIDRNSHDVRVSVSDSTRPAQRPEYDFSIYQDTADRKDVRELKYRGVIEGNTINFIHPDMRTASIIRFTATRTKP